MRITVIIADYGAAYHMGADVERNAKTFDLPEEIAEFVRANTGKGKMATISFALEETP